ncbi:MAG: DNA-binding domain-containing protein [Pseudomonadota bacterium]
MTRDGEAALAGALLAPGTPAPAAVADAHRFNVYRNNVVVGLIDAVAATYPAVLALVGEAFFRAAARAFVLENPPRSPIMIDYGGAFPGWIAAFPPAASVPYLSDVARLEWAWTRAYNAADAPPLDLAHLVEIPPDELALARVTLHPSLQLMSSRYPIASLWAEATGRSPATELDLSRPESVLIARPDAAVDVRAITPTLRTFLNTLSSGGTVSEAAASLGDDQASVADCLTSLFELRIAVSLLPEPVADHRSAP